VVKKSDTKLEDKPLVDSGRRTTFATGGQRELLPGKGRYDLLPGIAINRIVDMTGGQPLHPSSIRVVAKVFEKGSLKYSARNWEKGLPLWSFLDSGLRHLYKAVAGLQDEDHEGQAFWNFLCLFDTDSAITHGDMPEHLREPLPRRQQWQMCLVSDSVPSLATTLQLMHAYAGTGDRMYLARGVRMLCEIIGIRESVVDATGSPRNVGFKIGDVVDITGTRGPWQVIKIDRLGYRCRCGTQERTCPVYVMRRHEKH